MAKHGVQIEEEGHLWILCLLEQLWIYILVLIVLLIQSMFLLAVRELEAASLSTSGHALPKLWTSLIRFFLELFSDRQDATLVEEVVVSRKTSIILKRKIKTRLWQRLLNSRIQHVTYNHYNSKGS